MGGEEEDTRQRMRAIDSDSQSPLPFLSVSFFPFLTSSHLRLHDLPFIFLHFPSFSQNEIEKRLLFLHFFISISFLLHAQHSISLLFLFLMNYFARRAFSSSQSIISTDAKREGSCILRIRRANRWRKRNWTTEGKNKKETEHEGDKKDLLSHLGCSQRESERCHDDVFSLNTTKLSISICHTISKLLVFKRGAGW